jgi:hypothetical protein
MQNKTTHKGSKNPLLNFYYTFPYALMIHCVGHEVFLIVLYLMASSSSSFFYPAFLSSTAYITFPMFFMKSFMHIVQLYDAMSEVVEADEATKQ